jgi:hypothetical protein
VCSEVSTLNSYDIGYHKARYKNVPRASVRIMAVVLLSLIISYLSLRWNDEFLATRSDAGVTVPH